MTSTQQGNSRKGISPPPGSTYAGQSSLPRLPIPTLQETLNRFPDVVSAIVNEKDRIKCQEEITKFLKTDGPVLQRLLMEYEQKGREEGNVGSFVEEFWTDAYLTPDSSVVMNLNPFFVLEVCPPYSCLCLRSSYPNIFTIRVYFIYLAWYFPLTQDGPDTKKSNSQSRRAASLCFSAIKFASSLKNETIVPDAFRGKSLCMDQFRVCHVI